MAPLFLLRPYILQDAGTILFGPPGKGKSWIALAMAVSIDSGTSRIWPTIEKKVLFVNLERSRISFQRRLWAVNGVLGLEYQRPLLFINARGQALSDLVESIQHSVATHKVSVVFLDSISRAGMGALAEDRTANSIVDTLNRTGVAWFAIGHTPRAEDTHIYGSFHFEAGEDIGIRLISQVSETELGIGLEVVKANDIRIPPKAFYALDFGEESLVGIRTAKDSEFPDLLAQQQPNVLERIDQFIFSQPKAMATPGEVGKALGMDASNVAKLLAQTARYKNEGHADGDQRRTFYSVLSQEMQVEVPGV